MDNAVKDTLKDIVRNIFGRDFYRSLYLFDRRVRGAYYIFTHDLTRLLIRHLLKPKTKDVFHQKYLSWRTNMPTIINHEQFLLFLEGNQINYIEGCFSIYIPPQSNLRIIFGSLVDFYPDNAGYKILKDFSPPNKSHYLRVGYKVSWEEFNLVGSPTKQVETACALNLLGLGPKVYDLVELISGDTRLTCFVVQHIISRSLTEQNGDQFLKKLDDTVKSGLLGVIVPYNNSRPHKDFSKPDFNGNLLSDQDGNLNYVDFQQFVLRDKKKLINKLLEERSKDLAFGDAHLLRKNRTYLYQSIPGIDIAGKRESITRWKKIRELLAKENISINRRLILDICCNSGVMSSLALSDGALWALGWDLPEVATSALKVQRALGFTRIDIVGAHIDEQYSILSDIESRFIPYLQESIIFYLAAWRHIGFISELAHLDWRALVFEGHERSSDQNNQRIINLFLSTCNCRLAATTMIKDGDSEPRPLFLFVR